MNMNFFTRAFQESNYSVLVLLISNKKGRDVLEHYSSPAQLSVFGSRAFSAVSRRVRSQRLQVIEPICRSLPGLFVLFLIAACFTPSF